MTTTTIAGVEFPNEMIEESAAVAEALDRIMPEVMALLDRLAASYSETQLAMLRGTDWELPDEVADAVRDQTGFGRLMDHWYDLHYRTEDHNLPTQEMREAEKAYDESPAGRERIAELHRLVESRRA